MKNIYKALNFIWTHSKGYFFLYFFISIYMGVSPIILIHSSQKIINELSNEQNTNVISFYIIIIMSTSLMQIIIAYIKKKSIPRMESKIHLLLNREIILKMSKVSLSFFDDHASYDKIEGATREIGTFTSILGVIFNIFSNIITFILIIPNLFILDKLFILLIVVCSIPVIFIQYKIKEFNYKSTMEINKANRFANGTKHMLVDKYYAPEIRSYNLFDWLYEKFENYTSEAIKQNTQKNKKQGMRVFIIDIINLFSTIIIQIISIFKVIEKTMLVGDYVAGVSYCGKFNSSIQSLINNFFTIHEKKLFLNNLFNFLEYTEEIEQGKNIGIDDEFIFESLEFRDVTFSYPNNERNILNKFNLKIENGETIALVGLNGAGKTTIISLLLRFYKVNEGQILLNGIDINDYNLFDYYKSISVMFQTIREYPFSLKENIDFSLESNEKIYQYEWLMNVVNKYNQKLNTPILSIFNKNGVEPSIGERQRIGLARCILKQTAFLYILDEPSSSMDPLIEHELFSDLKSFCHNKTCLFISHRLSSTVFADRIIYLESGKIVEEGTHKELMNLNGKYKELFVMQSENYKYE